MYFFPPDSTFLLKYSTTISKLSTLSLSKIQLVSVLKPILPDLLFEGETIIFFLQMRKLKKQSKLVQGH